MAKDNSKDDDGTYYLPGCESTPESSVDRDALVYQISRVLTVAVLCAITLVVCAASLGASIAIFRYLTGI